MTSEPHNTPSLAGWAIAFGIGVVGGAVSYVLLGLGANGSVLIGGVLLLVVGVILGLPSGAVAEAAPVAVAHAPVPPPVAPAAPPAPVAAPAVAPAVATVAAAVAAPSAPPVAAAPVVPPTPAPAPAPAPVAAAPVAQDRPPVLAAARDGKPDDLKQIKGVGPKLEAMLHRMGIFHFDQIAAWKAGELAWVDDNLEGFKGRASRDEWVAQAKVLAAGGSTEFSRKHGHD
jgi:predicted flap endonuclease-1-like 5' DNA nuclease